MFQVRGEAGNASPGVSVGCAPHMLPRLLYGVWEGDKNSQLLNKWLGSYWKIQSNMKRVTL